MHADLQVPIDAVQPKGIADLASAIQNILAKPEDFEKLKPSEKVFVNKMKEPIAVRTLAANTQNESEERLQTEQSELVNANNQL